MADKIDWGSIPGLSVDVVKELASKPAEVAKTIFEALSSLNSPLRDITAEQVRNYKSEDFGDASSFAVQSNADGAVRPVSQRTLEGRPTPQEPNTYAGTATGAFPKGIETERTTGQTFAGSPDVGKDEKKVFGEGHNSHFSTKNDGKEMKKDDLILMGDDEAIERYGSYFGKPPGDADKARQELIKLLEESKNKPSNLLD